MSWGDIVGSWQFIHEVFRRKSEKIGSRNRKIAQEDRENPENIDVVWRYFTSVMMIMVQIFCATFMVIYTISAIYQFTNGMITPLIFSMVNMVAVALSMLILNHALIVQAYIAYVINLITVNPIRHIIAKITGAK